MTGYEKWFLTMNMTIIAKFNHGKLQGTVWRMLEENGYLVADNLEMTGPDVLYIYPGFQLGLFGHFENGKMVDATPVFIEGTHVLLIGGPIQKWHITNPAHLRHTC